MAKRRRSSKSKSKKVSKVSSKAGRRIKIGAKTYQCYSKKVKKGFGRKGKTVRAFCRKPPKAA